MNNYQNKPTIDLVFFAVVKLLVICVTVCIGVLFALFILMSFNVDPLAYLLDMVKGVFYKPVKPLNTTEKQALELLISNGIVLTVDNLIVHITGFYNTVITVLLTLIGLISGLAFFYIKAQSYEKMESMTERKVSDFFNTDGYNDKLAKVIDSKSVIIARDVQDRVMVEFGDYDDKVTELIQRIQVLEGRAGQDTNLVIPPQIPITESSSVT